VKIEENEGLFMTQAPERFGLHINTRRAEESVIGNSFDDRLKQMTLTIKDACNSRL